MITYENVPVVIGGSLVLASTASVDESRPFSSYRGYGDHFVGPSGVHESGRKQITLSVQYLGNTESAFLPFRATGIEFVAVGIHDQLYSGLVTSFQASADPVSPIDVSASFVCFSDPTELGDYLTGTARVWHGGGSTIRGLPSVAGDPVSFTVSMSQSFVPYYAVGDHTLSGISRTDGTISVSLVAVDSMDKQDFPCVTGEGVVLTLSDICGGDSVTETIDNLRMTSEKKEVSEGQVLSWSAEFVRFF